MLFQFMTKTTKKKTNKETIEVVKKDIKLKKEPIKVADNLDAMEIDTVYETEKSWGNLKSYFRDLLTIQGNGGIEVEELLVFPGLEELFSMFKILDFYVKGL